MSIIPVMGFRLPSEKINCEDQYVGIHEKFLIRKGCGWKGLIKDTIKEDYCSSKESWRHLAGREGIKYICPDCKNILIDDILKIS